MEDGTKTIYSSSFYVLFRCKFIFQTGLCIHYFDADATMMAISRYLRASPPAPPKPLPKYGRRLNWVGAKKKRTHRALRIVPACPRAQKNSRRPRAGPCAAGSYRGRGSTRQLATDTPAPRVSEQGRRSAYFMTTRPPSVFAFIAPRVPGAPHGARWPRGDAYAVMNARRWRFSFRH
jgi:hypothetical protein